MVTEAQVGVSASLTFSQVVGAMADLVLASDKLMTFSGNFSVAETLSQTSSTMILVSQECRVVGLDAKAGEASRGSKIIEIHLDSQV